jgi:hypothetical protein
MGSVRDLVNELRNHGVVVHEWSNWDGRGNNGVFQLKPKGAIIHHTGTDYGYAFPGLVSSTRPGLVGGALANFSGNVDGSLTVLASGLTWHAGGGYGPSQGPLAPYANNRNYYTLGLEIVYPGKLPMTSAQYHTALKFSRVVADMFAGGDLEYVRGHSEVNGKDYEGKWDPGYAPGLAIDMNQFRADARNLGRVEDDMYTDGDRILMQSLAARVEALAMGYGEAQNGPDVGETIYQSHHLYEIQHLLRRLAALVPQSPEDGDYPGPVVDHNQEFPLVALLKELKARLIAIEARLDEIDGPIGS